MESRKLPIRIQDFEKLRTDGFAYVDKTSYVYKFAQEGNPYSGVSSAFWEEPVPVHAESLL